jgi:hypothetical protein
MNGLSYSSVTKTLLWNRVRVMVFNATFNNISVISLIIEYFEN